MSKYIDSLRRLIKKQPRESIRERYEARLLEKAAEKAALDALAENPSNGGA